MKIFSFLFLVALICVCVIEGASRQRRAEEDALDQIQKRLSEGFDSVKKAAEEMAAKVDFKQLQQDFTSKLDELAKSFNEFTSTANEKKAEETAPTP